MAEKENHKRENLGNICLSDSIDQVASKPQFKALLEELRQKTSIEDMLEERRAQAKLDVLLNLYSERSARADNLPIVVLKTEKSGKGMTKGIEHCVFQLKDNMHLYYFNQRWPEEPRPSYLREQDIVQSEAYENPFAEVNRPFNKPISRVSISGGKAESYSYRTRQWEDNGEGYFAGVNFKNLRNNSAFTHE